MQKIKMSRGVTLTFEEGCKKYLENCRQRKRARGIPFSAILITNIYATVGNKGISVSKLVLRKVLSKANLRCKGVIRIVKIIIVPMPRCFSLRNDVFSTVL